ncbi:MAG TPA: type III pantothenate kinase [Bacteroidales bacterium]|nr:type III pantothenate kinase [Bacteroidales bacterium]
MNLIFDIGNTQTKAAIYKNDKELFTESIPALTVSYIRNLIERFGPPERVILSSVSKEDSGIAEFLKTNTGYFIQLDERTLLPFQNLYETKNSLGKDRLAAIAGACNIFPGANVLVIDAGTAITFDFINDNNEFLGGNISPGLRMRFNALHNFTSKLPLLEPAESVELFGRNTNAAIISGIENGMIYEIEGCISGFRKKFPDLKVIFTGGDAIFFDKMLKSSIFVISNLVTLGLNRILNYNAEN